MSRNDVPMRVLGLRFRGDDVYVGACDLWIAWLRLKTGLRRQLRTGLFTHAVVQGF
jgi:hypothetical protein